MVSDLRHWFRLQVCLLRRDASRAGSWTRSRARVVCLRKALSEFLTWVSRWTSYSDSGSRVQDPPRPSLFPSRTPSFSRTGSDGAMSITQRELAFAAKTQVFTRNFRHLLPVPRFLVRGPFLSGQSKPKDTKPKDRIKYWNIVPGDYVKLRGDSKGTVHEVHRINKLSNRVILKREINKAVSILHASDVHQASQVLGCVCVGLCPRSTGNDRRVCSVFAVSAAPRKV